jgi:hypothetical protein
MAQHTPGPWLYRPLKHDDWGWVRTQDGTLVAVARNSPVTDAEQTAHRRNRTDPYEGNARLIAAAPDLLSYVRRCASNDHEANELLKKVEGR